MTAQEELHCFIDSLVEKDADLLLHAIRDHDPHGLALLTARVDDEPTTPDEDAGAAEAREQ